MKINNTTVSMPSVLKWTISDIDYDAKRNDAGKMVRDRKAVKRKLEVSWKGLTESQASLILSNCSTTSFSVEYFDPKTGATETRTFYVGDRTVEFYTRNSKIRDKVAYTDVSMSFIEI